MSAETWGQMPKAQNDGQTIAEAVAAAILAHEQDPEAHVGEGESLQAHRESEVIDHLQGSVLADKFSNKEVGVAILWDSLSPYTKTAGATATKGVLSVVTTADNKNFQYLKYGDNDGYFAMTFEKNMLFQSLLKVSHTTNILSYVVAGLPTGIDTTTNFGFKFYNGHVYGVQTYINESVEEVENTVDLGEYVADEFRLYRAQLSVEDGAILFYIDGVFSGQLTLETVTNDYSLALFGFSCKTLTTAVRSLSVLMFQISAETWR